MISPLLLRTLLPFALLAQVPQVSPPKTAANVIRRAQERAPFKIVLTGDSTVATGGGWGPGFCALLTPNVACVDLAANGRSSKSYLDEGLWQKALNEHGQYYLIQFGHNDQKPKPDRHTDPDTTYAANLEHFIRDVRGIGAIPVLVTPLSRRNYNGATLIVDPLKDYAAAARRVAAENKVALVDLYSLSTKLLSGMTQEQADQFDAETHPDAKAENGPGTKPDRTHLDDKGKATFGRMVADALARAEPELAANIKGAPAATLSRDQEASKNGH